MDLVTRFAQYADAFEEVFVNDDWSSLEPYFTENAVWGDNEFRPYTLSDGRGRYTVLFFYPLDFTFVCPSELIAFERRMPEFARRNVDVVGCSIDSAGSPKPSPRVSS